MKNYILNTMAKLFRLGIAELLFNDIGKDCE